MITTLTHVALGITAALFGSLWEGALIVGAVWLGLRCFAKLGAATRYAIWLCTLAALALAPVATTWLPQPHFWPPLAERRATGAQSNVSASAVRPIENATTETSEAPRIPSIGISKSLAVSIALIWMLAACARGIQLLRNTRDLASVRRNARWWKSVDGYPVLLSDRVQVPLATGFARPAIVLPASLAEQMPRHELDTIIAHEVAHLRRNDVWTNAFARVTEALVVLNPIAWVVVRRLSVEREIACDDWVVAQSGAGEVLAVALATLAGRTSTRPPLAAPTAIGSQHSVVERIERLLDSRPRCLRPSPSALGATLALLAIIALSLQSISPVLAFEQQTHAQLASGSVGRVSGVIVSDRSGQPACGAVVEIDWAQGPRTYARTRADGSFQILAAQPGPVTVHVLTPSRRILRVTFDHVQRASTGENKLPAPASPKALSSVSC